VEASQILFGKGTTETLRKLKEDVFLSVFEGVPNYDIPKNVLSKGIGIIDFVAESTKIFSSKGEARRMIKDNGLLINKQKANENVVINSDYLLNDKYILVQKGKKNYFIVRVMS
jgi:tyrosyl-tRNA synthetase